MPNVLNSVVKNYEENNQKTAGLFLYDASVKRHIHGRRLSAPPELPSSVVVNYQEPLSTPVATPTRLSSIYGSTPYEDDDNDDEEATTAVYFSSMFVNACKLAVSCSRKVIRSTLDYTIDIALGS